MRPLEDIAIRRGLPWWRRAMRWRLRTVLVLILLLSILLGIWVPAARKQRDAVAVLERAGATVYYSHHVLGHEQPRFLPEWLVERLGIDFFSTVRGVSFDATDKEPILSPLADLPHVVQLTIGKNGTDEMLNHITGCTSLTVLDLDGSKVTDEGVHQLLGMSIQALWLENTRISDAALSDCGRMRTLHGLNLTGVAISDAGLKQLRVPLHSLFLRNTPISDQGLEHLGHHQKGLEFLDLGGTKITDAGIEHLRTMSQLEVLMLSSPDITDRSIAALSHLRSLKHLWVSGTKMTKQGRLQLKELLPPCSIN